MTNCDGCGAESAVVDSRKEPTYVRRRRKCLNCGARWTTYEVSEESYHASLRYPARAIARVEQAQMELASLADVLRENWPAEYEQELAQGQFESPNPRVKQIARPQFVRELAS